MPGIFEDHKNYTNGILSKVPWYYIFLYSGRKFSVKKNPQLYVYTVHQMWTKQKKELSYRNLIFDPVFNFYFFLIMFHLVSLIKIEEFVDCYSTHLMQLKFQISLDYKGNSLVNSWAEMNLSAIVLFLYNICFMHTKPKSRLPFHTKSV